jgi:hypothetical protein
MRDVNYDQGSRQHPCNSLPDDLELAQNKGESFAETAPCPGVSMGAGGSTIRSHYTFAIRDPPCVGLFMLQAVIPRRRPLRGGPPEEEESKMAFSLLKRGRCCQAACLPTLHQGSARQP